MGEHPSFLVGIYENAAHSPVKRRIYNLHFTFRTEYGIIFPSVRAVRSDFVWLVVQKRAASYLRVQMHFFRQKCHQHPSTPDTVTHGHGDTVAVCVASVYACLVVAVYGDWVLS